MKSIRCLLFYEKKSKSYQAGRFCSVFSKTTVAKYRAGKGVKIQLFCKAKRERQLTPRSANECETTPPMLIVAKNNRPTKGYAAQFF